ncbi:hypothetical protein [Streptomyces chrestomyceticus]|uniref:hypothetical protein n=1 Tax=Streptomyces chrestomyceticus TaxID=68185 RepID=UPI0035A859AF
MSDEEWERFLRESVAGAPGAPVEPSARAREVGRRLRERPGQPEGWRSYSPGRPRRKTGWYVAGLAAVTLLAVALFPQQLVGWFGDEGGQDGKPLAAESPSPRQAPGAEPALRPTLAEPFRGSPAARWADGAAGIAVPEAKATGWMDAAQVEQARLVGDVVKTRGRLTYREGKRGAVEVTADVTFVYPVTQASGNAGPGAEVIRTIVRRKVVMSWDNPAKVITEPGTMSLVSYALDMTNGGCSGPTGYFEPPFGTTEKQSADTAHQVDPYDRSKPIDTSDGTATAGNGCATATRS